MFDRMALLRKATVCTLEYSSAPRCPPQQLVCQLHPFLDKKDLATVAFQVQFLDRLLCGPALGDVTETQISSKCSSTFLRRL